MSGLKDITGRLLSLVFPERCALCGEIVTYGDLWCGKCECVKLGKVVCGDTANRLCATFAGAEYSGGVRKALLRIKSRPDIRTLKFFASLMAGAIESGGADMKFDVIVPVPTNESRLKKRGYNQAEKLAEQLSPLIGAPVNPGVLSRREDSLIQHTLNRDDRRLNAEKAYDILNHEGIEGKSVLLVDDVLTTGSTLATCGEKLLDAGAARICAVAATAVRQKI